MCLIVLAHAIGPHSLVFAANRDEAYDRPTDAAAFWSDAPGVFGGRDREMGGTWLALSDTGRLAAVTNVRSGAPVRGHLSRGALCANFVLGKDDAKAYADRAYEERAMYGGFNLLVRAGGTLAQASSDERAPPRVLVPGIYGVSNASIDVAWPKVVRAKAALSAALSLERDAMIERLFAMLADREVAPDDVLPQTGIPLAVERAVSPIFIATELYGTRASTVIVWGRDGEITFEERSFGRGGAPIGVVRQTIHSS